MLDAPSLEIFQILFLKPLNSTFHIHNPLSLVNSFSQILSDKNATLLNEVRLRNYNLLQISI